MMQRKPWFMILVLFLILVPLEVAVGFLVYYTMGEVMRSLYLLLIVANLGFLALCVSKPKLGVTLALFWALLLVPYQGMLATRLWRAQREAGRIVTWAYEARGELGTYPVDLSGYTPADEGIMEHIQLYEQQQAGDSFYLVWSPLASPSTNYSYDPVRGWMHETD